MAFDPIYSLLAQASGVNFAEFIEGKLTELGITKNRLCTILGIDNKSLTRVLGGEAQKVDVVLLLKLSRFFGVDYREFSQRYVAELEPSALRQVDSVDKAGFVLRNFDLPTLRKAGFISQIHDYEEIAQRIRLFFDYEALHEFDHDARKLAPLFSRTRNISSGKMLRFWCTAALAELNAFPNPNPLDIRQVKEVMAMASILTSDEVGGLVRAVRSLYLAGVTVLINPYVGKTQVRGATFIVNDKPGIILQDFGKRYSAIWFALLHELCHVIKDLEWLSTKCWHISFDSEGEGDLFDDPLIEDRANKFAADLLLTSSKLKYIAPFIDIPGMVLKHAKKWQVHPSIIYGQYAYHYNEPKYYGKCVSAETAVRHLMIDIYKHNSIREAVESKIHIYQGGKDDRKHTEWEPGGRKEGGV